MRSLFKVEQSAIVNSQTIGTTDEFMAYSTPNALNTASTGSE